MVLVLLSKTLPLRRSLSGSYASPGCPLTGWNYSAYAVGLAAAVVLAAVLVVVAAAVVLATPANVNL